MEEFYVWVGTTDRTNCTRACSVLRSSRLVEIRVYDRRGGHSFESLSNIFPDIAFFDFFFNLTVVAEEPLYVRVYIMLLKKEEKYDKKTVNKKSNALCFGSEKTDLP